MPRLIPFGLVVLLFLSMVPHVPAQAANRPIELSVDATEAPRRLLHAHYKIPVSAGPLTLYYPKWIQGEHAPTGPINDLSGLTMKAADKSIAWRRDDLDLYTFHCDIPPQVETLEVSLDFLGASAKDGAQTANGPSMTPHLAILKWDQLLLYPKKLPVREMQFKADIAVPDGWKLGTALPIDREAKNHTQFKTVSLEMLADSPVLFGRHFKQVPIGPAEGPPHYLVLACDSATGLELAPELKAHYDRLVVEAGILFGVRHYRSYRFLVAMSDHISHTGIEHHESSDNRVKERFLLDGSFRKTWHAWLLAHEFVHSWNGKYRRPEGLVTSDFQKPYRTNLLWVYEGLTQYLGFVMSARSGLYTAEQSRENFALLADSATNQRGRDWRPLEDTTVAAPHLFGARSDWSSRRRTAWDFYIEGALLWLDVDTIIREQSTNKKSFDNFCQVFFAGRSGAPDIKEYNFQDIVQSLNAVVPYEWQAFFERRVKSVQKEAPLDGIARSGWKVVHRAKPGDLYKAREADEKSLYLSDSIGLWISEDSKVIDVTPGKPADKAGIGPGMKVLGVNDRRFTPTRMREALAATAIGESHVRLLLENQEHFRTLDLSYADGDRYPNLQRVDGKRDLLSEIFRPRENRGSDSRKE